MNNIYEEYYDEAKENEILECFKMFDKDKDDYVNIQELKNILRSLSFEFSEEELEEILNDIPDIQSNNEGEYLIHLNQYKYIIQEFLKEIDIREELEDAFMNFVKPDIDEQDKTFDKSNKQCNSNTSITIEEFSHYMKSFGDKLTNDEVEEMIKDSDPNNTGYIECKDFVKLITSK